MNFYRHTTKNDNLQKKTIYNNLGSAFNINSNAEKNRVPSPFPQKSDTINMNKFFKNSYYNFYKYVYCVRKKKVFFKYCCDKIIILKQ